MSLADYQALFASMVRDDTGKIATTDRDSAIEAARLRYSGDRPKTAVEDLTAAGGNLLDLPAGWQADFSALRSLEAPIGNVPPTFIASSDWSLYQSPDAIKIQLLSAVVAGDEIRATYTIMHQLDATHDTIPIQDRDAVASYAAALGLEQLASWFTGESDSTIDADTVNHGTKGADYAARARALKQKYFNHLGVDPKRNVAASATVNLPREDSRGRPRLTHR